MILLEIKIVNFSPLQWVGGGTNYLQLADLAPTQLGNSIIGWESTKSVNLGFYLGMFNNWLTITTKKQLFYFVITR